jgi:hypothetical protein
MILFELLTFEGFGEATETLNSAIVPSIGLNGPVQHICYGMARVHGDHLYESSHYEKAGFYIDDKKGIVKSNPFLNKAWWNHEELPSCSNNLLLWQRAKGRITPRRSRY